MKRRNHDKISLVNKIENSDNRWGWLVLLIYIAAVSFVTYFHEPWFDEAQSWIIARDVSIRDIIFYIPHYEGHPPLWHLYLLPFAKSGMPYELGIKLASIIVNAAAIALIIFKAPFKKIIRYLIPFTYYFFFMYGVVSRCYSFTMLGFVLMAVTYKHRNSKPFGYILSMMLVCASTAYGIMFCAGTAIVWLIEIIREDKIKSFIPRFIKDKRFAALAALLLYAVVLVLLILPRNNTFAANLQEYENPLILRLLYMFFLAPLEASFFTPIPGNYTLMFYKLIPRVIFPGLAMFLVLGTILYFIGKNFKTLFILILPYALFALFAGSVYFTEHHASIITYFLLFWFWISFDSSVPFDLPDKIKSSISPVNMDKAKKIAWLLPAALIGIPIYWNIVTCAMDIQVNYSSAKEIAAFVSENKMENSLIMAEWLSDKTGDDMSQRNINYQFSPAILAYFDSNIIYTFNDGDDALCYCTHIVPTQAEVDDAYDKWRMIGAPDVLIGQPNLNDVFEGIVTYKDYTLVKVINEKRVTKDDYMRLGSLFRIYVRNDLVEQYGFEAENEEFWIDVLTGKEKLP